MADPAWEIVYPRGVVGREGRERYRRYLMPVLVPASWAYYGVSGAVRGSRTAVASKQRTAMKVVSVGNLEVGGSGKTPLTMELVSRVVAGGGSPVYVSRGYGGEAARLGVVTVVGPGSGERYSAPPDRGVRFVNRDHPGLATLVGDEGAVVARRLPGVPLLFCRDKGAALEAADRLFEPTHAVMDDAFQSWGVPRDVDVVVVDGARPFGSGWLLPAGTLREPPEALERADVVGAGGIECADDLERVRREIADKAGVDRPLFGFRRRIEFGTEALKGAVAVLSGIGRPEVFERQVAGTGADVVVAFRYPDHYRYRRRDIEWIVGAALGRGADVILTTAKDWVKVAGLDPPPGRFETVRLSLELFGDDVLDEVTKKAAD